jgi:hypothetical protein
MKSNLSNLPQTPSHLVGDDQSHVPLKDLLLHQMLTSCLPNHPTAHREALVLLTVERRGSPLGNSVQTLVLMERNWRRVGTTKRLTSKILRRVIIPE